MKKFDIEAILRTANLRQLVEKAGGQPDQHGRCACPIHGGNDTNAFHVFEKDGKELWKCFSGDCGGGDAISFVQKWQHMDFKQACVYLDGDVISDPVAMEKSAQERLEKARIEHEETRLKVEARQRELQVAEKHLFYHNCTWSARLSGTSPLSVLILIASEMRLRSARNASISLPAGTFKISSFVISNHSFLGTCVLPQRESMTL